jgi:hypothetical protein
VAGPSKQRHNKHQSNGKDGPTLHSVHLFTVYMFVDVSFRPMEYELHMSLEDRHPADHDAAQPKIQA